MAVVCQVIEDDRSAALAIRHRVFVEEQGVPVEEEQDAYDAEAVHVLVTVDGVPAGTARMVGAKIGRVAVLPEYRGRGLGGALMACLTAEARRRGLEELVLDAQVQVIPFYERLGYRAEGPEFMDAGIRHRRMRRAL